MKKHFNLFLSFISFIALNQHSVSAISDAETVKFNSFSDIKKCLYILEMNPDRTNDFYNQHLSEIKQLTARATSSDNKQLLHYIDFINALNFYHLHKLHKAVPLFQSLLEHTEFLNYHDSASILSNLKDCFVKLANYPTAFEIHQKINSLILIHPDLSISLLDPPVSHIYYGMGLYNEAIINLRKEYHLKIVKHINEKYIEPNFYNNLGVIWQKAGQADSAIFYFQLAKKEVDEQLKTNEDKTYLLFFSGLIDGNIGQAYMQKHEIKKAISLLQRDIYLSTITGRPENAAISQNELAQCYIDLKDYATAEKHIDSASVILSKVDDIVPLLQNIKLKAMLYNYTHRYAIAVEHYARYIRMKDSISNQEKELELINQQVAYNVNQQESTISEQQMEVESEKQKTEIKENQRNIFLSIAIALLIISVLFFYFYRKSVNRQKLLSEKNILINESLKEKEVLIKEVHHRVKNNLQIISSLLSLQADKIENPDLQAHFTDARQRIQSMALIHELLYRKDKIITLPMKDYIENLAKEISASFKSPDKNVSIITSCENIYFNLDTAIPLGLIINELITNSFKHAFQSEGRINITLEKINNKYQLIIQDNGKGLPPDFVLRKSKSLGMELIEILCNQLSAKIELKNSNGFSAIITFSYT